MKKKNLPEYESPCLKIIEIQIEQAFMQSSSQVNEDTTNVGYEDSWDEEIVTGNGDILIKN